MEEFQVTAGGQTNPVERPFFVLATQNPIEQEGTYPLPVTQLDRFMFQIDVDYPDSDTEFEILATTTSSELVDLDPVLTRAEIAELLSFPPRIEIPPAIIQRAVRLVRATRRPKESEAAPESGSSVALSETAHDLLSWGAGPRAVQAILTSARGAALLAGRSQVNEADYELVALSALRHRVILNYHAEAEKIPPDEILSRIRVEIGDKPAEERAPEIKPPGRFARLLRAIGDPNPPMRRT